jgi:hypothetical protein
MDNPEKLATLSTQYTGRRKTQKKTKNNNNNTTIYANKHK